MVNLFTTYYDDTERYNELMDVLRHNVRNDSIDRIFLLNESETEIDLPKVTNKKIIGRPTFSQIFEYVNEVSAEDDINIVANSDIYFDETGLNIMSLMLTESDCWALTRWDVKSDNMVRVGNQMLVDAVFMDRCDSQDSFVFRGKIRGGHFDFKIGIPGCDNSLLFWLEQSGYKLLNPSWTVKTYHLHKSEHRNWHGTEPIPRPYLLIYPTVL